MKKIVLLLLAVGFAWGLKAQSDFLRRKWD